ncbi:P450-derived glycosyltransferase activator [Streptomyces spiramyceticus]|uniref:Glycosyltransferase auxiliary protein n=1 Tax=Streptomyces spiramyceticus TaxID=299717 RepID=A0A411PXC2_9ACTN|nr:P450-derived glycosyltransferase activator [Streptomyces spiramyceticus]QBG49761.1 glycosyltransferase auxiliary protein [Streptomyces spiramyceticus]
MPILAMEPAPASAGTRELGRRLQLTRAAHWCAGNQGDPYALILRAVSDPEPLEREICAAGPWFHSELLGAWVTADPEVAAAVLADPRFGTLDRAGRRPDEELLPLAEAFPRHERAELVRLRALADPVLNRCAPAEAPCAARTTARRVLRRLLPTGGAGFDLVTEVARPYAVELVLGFLGVPDRDRDAAARALAACAPQLDARLAPQILAVARESADAVRTLADLVPELVAEKLRAVESGGPRPDDVLALLLRDGVAPRDVERIALVLAIGAPEPAATAVAHTVHRLLGRPGEWERARRTPAAARAVEQTLRHRPPARLESRVAHTDLELGGRRIAADEHIVVLAAAGRETPGPEPLGGPDGPHLALALPLIRLATTTAVQVMAGRLPGLRAEGAPLTRPRSPVVGACARLRVHPG